MIVGLAALLACAVLPQAERLILDGPRGSRDSEIRRAGEALHARLKADGIKDVTLTVQNSKSGLEIELAHKDKFSPAQVERIKVLASIPADDVSVAVSRLLTAEEAKQFEPYKQKKAPQGWVWRKLAGLWRCVQESGEIPASEFSLQSDGDRWFYKPSDAARPKLDKVRQDPKAFQPILVLDAAHFVVLKGEELSSDGGRFELRPAQLGGAPPFILKHPMPVALVVKSLK